jgi:mitochondrial fission protein ELM1
LLDGRPGHEKQTMGIIQALQKRVDVQVNLLQIKQVSLFKVVVQAGRLFFAGKDMEYSEVRESDLLLGTGSRTHLLMLLYKKLFAIPAVTCMTPALYLRYGFDLCFVPEHDGKKEKGNIVLTAGSPNCSYNKKIHQHDRGLILLGGEDTKSHHWNGREVVDMVEKVVLTDSRKRWILSSSPRTPQSTIDLVRKLSDKYGVLQFFDYRDTPSGWVEEQYDRSDVVWVTSDSISMIYEALTAGCKVGIFPMHWVRKNSKFKRNEDALLERGLVKSFATWEQGNLSWGENIELNEAQNCAERILKKWWPENLQ